MADSVQDEHGGSKANQFPPVIVKKYANRRLYNTDSSSYITLDTLADMVRGGREFTVHDAKTGDDITRGVLTQIIVEEESKGRAMLPTNFLRQLIGFYGHGVQSLVPRYLEEAMASFARQQEQVRRTMQQTLGPFMPFSIEEVGRQNLAMMERAMSLFSPFHRDAEAAEAAAPANAAGDTSDAEVVALRAELGVLRAQLETATKAAEEAVRPAASEAVQDPAPHVGAPARDHVAVPEQPPAPAQPDVLDPRRILDGPEALDQHPPRAFDFPRQDKPNGVNQSLGFRPKVLEPPMSFAQPNLAERPKVPAQAKAPGQVRGAAPPKVQAQPKQADPSKPPGPDQRIGHTAEPD